MSGSDVLRRELLTTIGATGVGAITIGSGTAGASNGERYVVGTSTPAATDAAKRRADSVYRVLDFGDVGQAVAGRFSEEALNALQKNPNVRYVEVDGTVRAIGHTEGDQTLPWGIDRVDADVAHHEGETGSGADIAIIDTGIDDDHPDLRANVGAGKAFVRCRGRNCNYPWSDDNDHGTHCAGIADAANDAEGVVGVSTEATLHAVKVLDKNGSGTYSDVAAGVEYVADQGWDVGSLSLGASSGSRTIRDACQYANGKGVLLVAAAGNDGPCNDCVGYPAKYDTVMAISATSEDDSLAGFSSTGSEIELAAPGGGVYSTVVGGYDTFSGTSMACPHVSGAGGQLMANGSTNAEARDRLQSTAEDIGLAGNEQGYGLLDAENATLGDRGPSVSWANPTEGDEISGTVTVQIDATDAEDGDGSLTVEYRVDGGSWRDATYSSDSARYEDSWDSTSASDGDHALEARATDSAGNTSTAAIAVTTENTDDAPTVSWASPTEGDTVGGSVSLRIDANDDRDGGADLAVEWRVDGGSWSSAAYEVGSGYYEDAWDSESVTDADYVLGARATDTGGNTSSEASISVTVDNSNSAPSITGFELTNDSNPAWTRYYVDWGVTDDDGNLSSVTSELLDASGNVLDSDSGSASGSSETGTHYVESKGSAAEIRLTVSDDAGETYSETKSV